MGPLLARFWDKDLQHPEVEPGRYLALVDRPRKNEGACERSVRPLDPQMIRVALVRVHRALALEGQNAALHADGDFVPAHSGQLGGQHEPFLVLAQIDRRAPPRDLTVREFASAEDILEEAVQPILEGEQIVQWIPGGRGPFPPRPPGAPGAHRFDSSTSTYSASITSPSLAPPEGPAAPPGAAPVASPLPG